ncbi:FAD-dependent oxidoreductase [Rhodococcus sp. NPDC059968]|uniref:FAD-dependent oxidoreductase n=1 Tax=Rhodococcus sp. NPDC059968 TaxID=3347017 RepID=UPI0036716772
MSRIQRVAVIGAGPSGLYAADELAQASNVCVDVLERLPSPYGLVRYGVAPDHLKTKSAVNALKRVLERPNVRFLGNVHIGRDLTVDDLDRFYDAVVVANGASTDRRLEICGEDLHGSYSATEFVSWYSGHPESEIGRFTLDATSAAVIGHGNVAVDVTRILAKTPGDLRHTDMPSHVLDVLDQSSIEDIHLVGRRGPVHARFTTKELAELGDLANADVIVHGEDLELDEANEEAINRNRNLRRNYDFLHACAARVPQGRPRRIHIRFFRAPTEIVGTSVVEGVKFERTELDDTGQVLASGETEALSAQLVLRSVGYRGVPISGIPFDPARGVIPNRAGRILNHGAVLDGKYVTGWIKRGPSGVIGTNKADAVETVEKVIEDLPTLAPAPDPDPDGVTSTLLDRGVSVVTWSGWQQIDAGEIALGESVGRTRTKIHRTADMLELSGSAVVGEGK